MLTVNASRAAILNVAAMLLMSNAVIAQQANPQTLVVCGQSLATLTLKDKVLAVFNNSPECVATQLPSLEKDLESYFLTVPGHPEIVRGMLVFGFGNRLVTISKNWDVDIHSETDYGRVFIGLLHKFEEEGHTACTIKTRYQSNPDSDMKSATLVCGSKRVELYWTEQKGTKSIQITETLGF